MRVDGFARRETSEGVEHYARVRWRDGELRLWVAVPAELEAEAEDASPFACATLLPAMRLGEDLDIDGPVSPRLVRGLDRARDLFRAWVPTLHPTAVRVAEERPPVPRSDQTACFFSRGVDSTYSATVPRSYPAPVDRLVFSDRLEPLHDAEVRATEIRLANEVAERIGLPLAVVSTNVRELTDPLIRDWEDMVAGGLSFVAHALAGGARRVLIPSSQGPATIAPSGTSPLLDHLFSTEAVEICHDSVARGRVAKGLWLARERPGIAVGLKVCCVENRPDNCAKCGKCLLTMATLEAAGLLHAAEHFPHQIDLDAVAAMRLTNLGARADLAEVAEALDGPHHAELREAVLEAIGHPAPPYPGAPVPGDSPRFLARHAQLTLSLIRDGRPWPPLEDDAGGAE
jgi:hypothetical protein